MIPGTIQSPHAALVPPLFGRKKREKDRKIKSKNTASSSKQYYLLVYLFFLRTSRQKKAKIGGGTGEGTIYRSLYLVYVLHQGCFGQPRTIWRRCRLQKAATTRDRCVVRMCTSSILSRRATSPAPAQRKKLPLFFNLIQMGPRKNKYRISEIPRPGRYRTNME